MAWAFAMADQVDTLLFTALAGAAEQRMVEFNWLELANTSWAFALLDQADTLLFTALARAAEQRMGELNWQELITRPGRLQGQTRRSRGCS